jgi:hypothetical protein
LQQSRFDPIRGKYHGYLPARPFDHPNGKVIEEGRKTIITNLTDKPNFVVYPVDEWIRSKATSSGDDGGRTEHALGKKVVIL